MNRSARAQAQALSVPFSGTLGVLLLAAGDGLLTLSEGNVVLGQMISRANYRSPVTNLGRLLD